MKVLACIFAVILALIMLVFIFPFTGLYNIAASAPHTPFGEWYFETLMENSVERRAAGIKLPQEYFSASPEDGFRHYDEMCVPCHGAPGIEKSEAAKGMTPEPPDLSEEAKRLRPEEIFWIDKHGIKMTGMPSFGKSHGDKDLWAVAAFVKKLPDISPEVYRQLKEKYPGE